MCKLHAAPPVGGKVFFRIAAATWNTQALLNSIYANPAKSRRKIGLLGHHDVVALQETHGTLGDAAALGRMFPSYRCFASAAESPNNGGTMIFVANDFAKRFSHIVHTNIIHGRIHGVRLTADDGNNIDIINVHIPPNCLPQGQDQHL